MLIDCKKILEHGYIERCDSNWITFRLDMPYYCYSSQKRPKSMNVDDVLAAVTACAAEISHKITEHISALEKVTC